MRRGGHWTLIALAITAASARRAAADIDISVYGDTDAVLKTDGTHAGTQDGFAAAKLDFFTTSTVGRWTFLGETLFEAGTDNEYGVDVERVEVGYLYREWLRVFAGRYHTALGYYNDAYHHGTYFMVPVGRPLALEFEDGGGIIPAHNVGVHADGRFEVGDDHLRYDVEVANGRSGEPLVVQNNHDTNLPKAFNVRLRYEPSSVLEGLVVGGNVYFDSIPANTTAASAMTPAPSGPLHELILGAHAAYFEHGMHAIAEAMMVVHTEIDTGAVHRTYTVFGEVGHAFDSLTPYARYEWTRFPTEGDPYYLKAAADGYQTASIGLKHATTDNIALKVQAGLMFSDRAGSDPMLTLTGQLAFAF
ncbi:MAG TPA: hypothetical protein VIV58_33790 [Kofleriaceae bacterium]